MSVKGVMDRTVSRLLAPLPDVARWWARKTATAVAEGEIPWTPFHQSFAKARVAVVTTGGFHLPDQTPFDCDAGDPSFRTIPADAPLDSLEISHTHYDTRDAREDPNILLPLDRLRELVEEGVLGSLAPTHYSMMGYVPQVEILVEETVPRLIEGMRSEEVDFALLTPA